MAVIRVYGCLPRAWPTDLGTREECGVSGPTPDLREQIRGCSETPPVAHKREEPALVVTSITNDQKLTHFLLAPHLRDYLVM